MAVTDRRNFEAAPLRAKQRRVKTVGEPRGTITPCSGTGKRHHGLNRAAAF
jgi:hypothetical protein